MARGASRPNTFVLLLALLPLCCTSPQPAPKPAELALPPPPPPPPRTQGPILRAAWSFQTGQDACVAIAKARAASLRIAVRPQGLIRLSLALPGDAPARPVAHFTGPAGHWLIPGARAGHHDALFTLSRDEFSASRILMLLSGGALKVEPMAEDLPILSLPEAGAEGVQWFTCVRRIVI